MVFALLAEVALKPKVIFWGYSPPPRVKSSLISLKMQCWRDGVECTDSGVTNLSSSSGLVHVILLSGPFFSPPMSKNEQVVDIKTTT